MMKALNVSMLAASLLAMTQDVAMAQADPATRHCMQGEQEIAEPASR
ncbi:hypothetical protein [Microvirga calopogonii]|nr:hypothetical protein [Microvirga calopogonii]